jgi:glucokinase
VAHLQNMGLVEPMGAGSSNGGRPPQLIRFNSKLGYVIGADIGTSVVRAALADLDGAVIEEWVAGTNSNSTPKRVTALLLGCIRNLLSRHKIPANKILALAAGVPGITNARSGTVLSAPILTSGWADVCLRRILETETGISAVIENDVNLAAVGESWCGIARGVKNFIFLTAGTGVGAGIFVDGHLYHGSDWTAGEIGYLYVPGTEEAPLAIHRPGSLEGIIGARAIECSWRKLCRADHRTGRRLPHATSVADIFDLAAKGEDQAAKILQRTARILADAITNVCIILNSSLVVLGGRVGSHPALFEATRRIVDRNEFCRPRLALSALSRKAPLYGAVCLALSAAEAKIFPPASQPSRPLALEEPPDILPSLTARPVPGKEGWFVSSQPA